MIDATTQLVLLNVNVETVGDVGTFSIHGNQFVIPGRYIVFERSVEKEFVEQNVLSALSGK